LERGLVGEKIGARKSSKNCIKREQSACVVGGVGERGGEEVKIKM
jgi:hypothetical protein